MSNDESITDDDLIDEPPTESGENRDTGSEGKADTGDEPTERDDDRDVGGEGTQDTGDEA